VPARSLRHRVSLRLLCHIERWARNLRADSPTIVRPARRVRLTRLFDDAANPTGTL
jgi:hypothetical protein